jgi:hypothetical protein
VDPQDRTVATPPTPPPAPAAPQKSGGGNNKILIGCAVGCGLLLLLVLVAGGLAYVKLIKPIADQAAAMEEANKANAEARAELDRLDQANAPSIGEDLGAAQLAASDVDSYLDLRAALADEAEAAAAAKAAFHASFDVSGLAEGNPLAMFGMMGDLFKTATAHQQARGELIQAAARELDAAGMSPTDFERMLVIVEWRFLQREEALTTALTADERADWLGAEFSGAFAGAILDAAAGQAGAGDTAQLERQLEDAQERQDELRAAAAERTALSAATTAVLEARRAELQALPARGLEDLGSLTDAQDPSKWLEGLQGMR